MEYREKGQEMNGTQNSAQEIAALYDTILARKTADPTDSYSVQLLMPANTM